MKWVAPIQALIVPNGCSTVARAWFEQALVVLEELPETKGTLEPSFEICLELRHILFQLNEFHRGLKHLREAEGLAERLNDDHRRGRVCAELIHTHTLLGELDDALGNGIRALEIAARLGDLKLSIKATSYLAQAHCSRAEYPQAIELATANLAKLPADCVHEFFDLPTPASVHNRAWLVASFTQLGRFAEAAQCGAEILQLAELTEVPFTVGFTHMSMTELYMLKGDWARARLHVEQAIAVFRTRNIMLLLPGMIAASARVLAQLGELREALTRLREGEELLERQAAAGASRRSKSCATVPLSSRPIIRDDPTTSAKRIAASLRCSRATATSPVLYSGS